MARRKAATDLPSFDKLMIPTIKALQEYRRLRFC